MPKKAARKENGQFPKGVSGNPLGRPKGSKNEITLLKQSLELMLREQAAPNIPAVLDKAVEMALDGHPGMIKMLVELHMSKSTNDEAKGGDKVAIQINSHGAPAETKVAKTTIDSTIEDNSHE